MKSTVAILAFASIFLGGCASGLYSEFSTCPGNYVKAGVAMESNVRDVKRALSHAGIPSYAYWSEPPAPYRIFVPPEKLNAAVKIINDTTEQKK